MDRKGETDMKAQLFIIGSLIIVALAASTSCAQQTSPGGSGAPQVDPAIVDLPISAGTVTDVHLHPLFTTTIRLPDAVTSVAVGAPTLFKVEHSADDPRLVFIKPTTGEAATSKRARGILLLSATPMQTHPRSRGTCWLYWEKAASGYRSFQWYGISMTRLRLWKEASAI
jgi:hypothetical protein